MGEARAVRVKDLFDIPEHVRKTDFVVKLSEGVDRAEETAATYVVTSAIRDAACSRSPESQQNIPGGASQVSPPAPPLTSSFLLNFYEWAAV